MMGKRMTWLVVVLALMLAAGSALAGEVVGKIQRVDLDSRTFVLEDGTQLFAPEGTSMEQLTEGTRVKAAYEERDGKNWITGLEIVSDADRSGSEPKAAPGSN